jgi:hypothetical protein
MFKAATVQNGRFPIKRRRQCGVEKEDCWVLVAERTVAETDAGQHDLWMHCDAALARVSCMCSHDGYRKQLKLILGSVQRLNAVQNNFGSTAFNERMWDFEEHSGSFEVDVIPSMLRADHGYARLFYQIS